MADIASGADVQTTDQVAPGTDPGADTAQAPITAPAVNDTEIVDYFRAQVEQAKRNRRSFHAEWRNNVDLRLGRVGGVYTGGITVGDDVARTTLNPDWALTKTKTANLYSQVPTVQVTHENKTYAAATPPFAKALNYELGEKRANIGVAMEEVLNDTVNAAGVGALIVTYSARFDTVSVPVSAQHAAEFQKLPPEHQDLVVKNNLVPMQSVPRPTSDKFGAMRISPTDLLWPSLFVGSNFDYSPWIGRAGRDSWAVAKIDFKLTDAQKVQVITSQEIKSEDDLRAQSDRTGVLELQTVRFVELFYWRYLVDPDEKSFYAIWRMVFVEGIQDPVINEPWSGQRRDPKTGIITGSHKFPIRVLTLTYITDNPIPPSDSSAGRPQVNDLIRSRDQMFKNRERSIPIRWYDVNRVDPMISDLLMRGTWQGMIPTMGDGSKSIGEIARASYPSEDLAFDRQTKADLMETWQVGPDQLGTLSQGDKTKAEVQITQANFTTRIGQERGKVASFLLGAAEVLSGLMVLYSDFPNLSDQEKQAMHQSWDFATVLPDVVLKILPDSTILLDSQARIQKLMSVLNMVAKSGYINPQPIIEEILELSGLDPAEIMVQPQAPAPPEPNMSYRFTGKDDIINPVVMAMLIRAGQAPTPDEVEQAKQLLLAAQVPAAPTPQPPAGPQQPNAGGPPSPSGLAGAPPPSAPVNPAQTGQEAHPNWALMSHIAKRSRDIGQGA